MTEKKEKLQQVKPVFEAALKTPFENTEDNLESVFQGKQCIYQSCDGSGYTRQIVNGIKKAVNCRCWYDEQIKRKLKNANMSDSYWDKKWQETNTEGLLLHPKQNPPPRQLALGKNNKPLAKQDIETPPEHVKRCYQEYELKDGLKGFVKEYTHVTLGYLNEKPVSKIKNLMLMGNTGLGKTFIANMIGKEYLLNDKKVYFTTMRSLIKDVVDNEKNIEKIVEEVDLLLIDELGYEYHTETGWAITNIKEFLRVRYNKKLPVVCTTNLYPSELEALYDASLMSLFNGTYFMIYLQREEGDYRLEEANHSLEDFTSFVAFETPNSDENK